MCRGVAVPRVMEPDPPVRERWCRRGCGAGHGGAKSGSAEGPAVPGSGGAGGVDAGSAMRKAAVRDPAVRAGGSGTGPL